MAPQSKFSETSKDTKMIYLIFALAVASRFLMDSHLPWFSPVFGALVFSGATLRKRDAVWFPVLVLAVGDCILTTMMYHMKVRWEHGITLLAFAAMAWGGTFLRHKLSTLRFIGCAIASSTAYFLISNFSVWLTPGTYPHTREGLAACYLAAVPYYRSSTLSTLIGGAALFCGYEFLRRRPHEQLKPAIGQAH
jgi:uncharacterized protein DUF6580